MEIALWSGLTQGAIFALVAMGFNLGMLPSGALNFAQGALLVGGSYLMYEWLTMAGLPSAVAVVLNILVGAAAGVACERITIRPLRRGSSRPIGSQSELITTVGMATVIVGVCDWKFGGNPISVPFVGPSGVLQWPGVRVLPVEVTLVTLAIVAGVGLFALFRFTRLGQACLAIAEDRQAAALRGINIGMLSIAGFAAAGALAGLTAVAVGPITYAIPTLANSLALGGFVALAIGGEGNFIGALIGGMISGVISSLAVRYLGANYDDLSVLFVLLATLLARPRGLGSQGRVRHV